MHSSACQKPIQTSATRHASDFRSWSSVCGFDPLDIAMDVKEKQSKRFVMPLVLRVNMRPKRKAFVQFVKKPFTEMVGGAGHSKIQSSCFVATFFMKDAALSGLTYPKNAGALQGVLFAEVLPLVILGISILYLDSV